MLDSQEAERQRIAAELHDSLGQSLLIIKNRAFLAARSNDDKEQTKEQLNEISSPPCTPSKRRGEIAYNLRPYQLDRLGLTQSLEEMIERVATATSIRFTINLPLLDGVFSKEGEAIFYRIVQESVNNIVKHSGNQRSRHRNSPGGGYRHAHDSGQWQRYSLPAAAGQVVSA